VKKICVLGLGYVGLPTAAMFASHGFQVLGVDINRRVVDTLSNGDVHIHEPGLKTLVQAALKSGNLHVACQPEPADAFIIAVPTPLRAEEQGSRRARRSGSKGADGQDHRRVGEDGASPYKRADLSYVIAAAESIVPHVRPRNLVVIESTVPPRTTVDILLPILERCGLGVRTADFTGDTDKTRENRSVKSVSSVVSNIFVAHCPERVLPGRILEELVCNDRVIGGVDRASAEMAKALYASLVEGEIFLTDATTAEMVKLMENTYRDVNIALANEFALVAEQVGINVWEAIELANRHPRVHILKPGPGVGGHCIAVDPWFIVQAAPEVTPLIQTAQRVNDGMPVHVVELVKRAMTGIEKPVIACLGLAYKADVDDTRESPALEVVRLLQKEGYEVRVCDPHVPVPPEFDVHLLPLSESLRSADCAVILTDHREFLNISGDVLGVMRHPIVIDTRNALAGMAQRTDYRTYLTLGASY